MLSAKLVLLKGFAWVVLVIDAKGLWWVSCVSLAGIGGRYSTPVMDKLGV